MSFTSKSFMVRTLLTAMLILAGAGVAFAQQVVSGTVKSASSGEPLAGATVLIKGTTSGNFTDENGKYSVKADGDAVLVVSYIGYLRQEVPVNGQSTVDISLEPSENTLEEVVVTGYGTQKAKEVTSAISSVKAEDFNRGNVNDPTQLVQGKVAGLYVSRPGGDPNGGFTLRLRGLTTLGANTQPLVIIDGVIGADLQTVDPNDIQSIDVLKDGSAAAIYGTRGSSGVIIITTKSGIPGETKINYNGYGTIEQTARTVALASADRFAELKPASNLGGATDWVDQVTRTGLSQVHNVSLTGGTTSTTYRASFNYRDINGVSLNSGFTQLNGRLNVQQKAIGDRLTMNINISATDRDASFGFNDALRYANIYNPTAPTNITEDEDARIFGLYGGYFQQELFDYFNPLAIAEQGVNEGQFRRILLSGKATFEIVEGLKVSGFYSQQRTDQIFGEAYRKDAYFRGVNRNGLARRATDIGFNQQFDGTINYDNTFGTTELSLLAGYSYQDFVFEGFGLEGGDFLSDAVSYNALGDAADFNNGIGTQYSYKNTNRLIAFFGRAKVNIDDTYFLEASVRQEGSSRFGVNNRWGTFPAVSGGVNLGNLISVAAINSLKVRAGYGITGATPGESYLSLLRFSPASNFFFEGNFVPAYAPSLNANPDLKWETKREFNAGVDFALLDFKLSGTLDFYTRTTRDLLFNVGVPVPPNQASRTWGNLEDIALVNTGFEASIGYEFGSGDFTYEPRVLVTTFVTVLDTVAGIEDAQFTFFDAQGQFLDNSTSPGAPGLNDDPSVIVLPGEQIGQFYGFEVNEAHPFITAETPEDQNPLGFAEGEYNFIDQDGDGDIDQDDHTIIGNGLPNFTLGINNTFRLGNFDVNFFIRGVFGHEMINHYRLFYETLSPTLQRYNLVETSFFDERLTANPILSSHFVEDASFVTLDNATVGYTFPISGGFLDQARIYFSGQNLFFITNYTGVDPSVRYTDSGASDNGGRATGNNPLAPGLDRRNTYFRTRQFTGGVSLTF